MRHNLCCAVLALSTIGMLASCARPQHDQMSTFRQEKAQCNPSQPFSPDPGIKEWTSVSKPGDGSVFMFRGNKIGDPIRRLFPCHSTTISKFSGDSVNRCTNDQIPGVSKCNDVTANESRTINGQPSYGIFIGNIELHYLHYYYSQGALSSFDASMPLASWPDFSKLLAAKYGPSIESRSSVKNAMGATFETITDTWKTPDGDLVLRMRFPTIDTAYLSFRNPQFERYKAEAEKKIMNDKAKGSL